MRTTGAIAVVGFLGFAMLGVPRPVEAQTGGSSPRGHARAVATFGAGAMNPLHADDYPEGGVYLGALGLSITPRFSIEGEVTRRAAVRESDRFDVLLPDLNCHLGQPCQPGHADRDRSSTTSSDWTAGVNFLRRIPRERISMFAGGGFMVHHETTRTTRVLTNCTNPGHADPSFLDCSGFDRRHSSQGVGFQGLAGLDLALTSRLQIFGGIRYELRGDLGMGTFGATAGVRVGLR